LNPTKHRRHLRAREATGCRLPELDRDGFNVAACAALIGAQVMIRFWRRLYADKGRHLAAFRAWRLVTLQLIDLARL